MLTAYINQTQRLLQNPGAPTTLYSTADITYYINVARGQIAGEGRCVRRIGSLVLSAGSRVYPFSSVSGLGTDTQGVINVRNAAFAAGGGQLYLTPLPFEWFWLYSLNTTSPASGQPQSWAQLGQGSAGTGSITGVGSGTVISGNIYFDPIPNSGYTVQLDCACYPVALAADTDPEAIPYLWTDAVPYYAAYLALMSSQTSVRIEQAQRLLQLYEMFIQRARSAANPDVMGVQYSQAPNPARLADVPTAGQGAQ